MRRVFGLVGWKVDLKACRASVGVGEVVWGPKGWETEDRLSQVVGEALGGLGNPEEP